MIQRRTLKENTNSFENMIFDLKKEFDQEYETLIEEMAEIIWQRLPTMTQTISFTEGDTKEEQMNNRRWWDLLKRQMYPEVPAFYHAEDDTRPSLDLIDLETKLANDPDVQRVMREVEAMEKAMKK